VRLAEEGANVIAFDVAGPVEAQGAPAAANRRPTAYKANAW
jgi:hypothetical protein